MKKPSRRHLLAAGVAIGSCWAIGGALTELKPKGGTRRTEIGAGQRLVPPWIPAPGEIRTISYAKGSHPNGIHGGAVLEEISPSYQPWNPAAPAPGLYGGGTYQFNTMHAYGGSTFNADTRQIVDYGAGHSAFNVCAPYAFDLNDLTWKWLDTPLPTDGLYRPRTKGYNAPITQAQFELFYPVEELHCDWQYSYTWGDWNGNWTGWPATFGRPGRIFPEPGHSRASNCVIPGSVYGNANGAFLKVAASTGSNSGTNAKGTHLFDFDTGLWERTANRPNVVGGKTCLDERGRRVLVAGTGEASAILSSIRIFDIATKSWLSNCACTSSPFWNISVDAITFALHQPSDLVICAVTCDAGGNERSSSPSKQHLYAVARTSITAGGTFAWATLTLSNPRGTWPKGAPGVDWVNGFAWAYCPLDHCYYAVNGQNGSKSMWKLSPPSAATQKEYLTRTWTITEEAMTKGALYHRNSLDGASGSSFVYTRLSWDASSRSFIWFSDSVNGVVQALRPLSA